MGEKLQISVSTDQQTPLKKRKQRSHRTRTRTLIAREMHAWHAVGNRKTHKNHTPIMWSTVEVSSHRSTSTPPERTPATRVEHCGGKQPPLNEHTP